MPFDNIILENTETAINYKGSGFGNSNIPNNRNRISHSELLNRELVQAIEDFKIQRVSNLGEEYVSTHLGKMGTYIEFSGAENYDLVTKSLEVENCGIRLMNVREVTSIEDDTKKIKTLATVYIPKGKEEVFIKKISDYANDEKNTMTGKPKNNDLVASIESINNALKISAFWTSKSESIVGDEKAWCEIWFQKNEDEGLSQYEKIKSICNNIEIEIKDNYIDFPERMIVGVMANKNELLTLISLTNDIAEIRKLTEPNQFFLELSNIEQSEWIEETLSRVALVNTQSRVCLLDTGVNNNHPLIEPYFDHNARNAIDSSWNVQDNNGHGTEMAGIAIFKDLKNILATTQNITINHQIESVKLLEPRSNQTTHNLYGAVTENAVSLAEISSPNKNRVYCMAVTAENNAAKSGLPSSWSAALDKICYAKSRNSNNVDAWRLFVVSAGNVSYDEIKSLGYPDSNLMTTVEDPGQSWNAITVGAYSKEATTSSVGMIPIAKENELSPFSSTTFLWDKKWPIKPEVVCDGGNLAIYNESITEDDELSKLTLNHNISNGYFTTTHATSAATAEASYIISELTAKYPDLWPEAIRALFIHSANWSEEMITQFIPNAQENFKTKGRRKLLRCCGYGIPSLDKAISSAENRVNLIIQGTIQPFKKEKSSGKMNEMHLHQIPWPKEILESLENNTVKLKVTLSYFIEPSPGEKGWKDKYRYQSGALRFELKKSSESIGQFKMRVNKKMRDEDYINTEGESNWFLGEQRDVGSIHSDIWEDTAINVSTMDSIIVFPIVGWWKERLKLNKVTNKMRYSLVVSLETPNIETELYTSIQTKIAARIPVLIN